MAEKFKYPTGAIRELAGVYMLAVLRINKEIEEMNLDYTETWDLINQEYDSLKQEASVMEEVHTVTYEADKQFYEHWVAYLDSDDSEWTFAGVDTAGSKPMFYLESYGDWIEVTAEEISRISVFNYEIEEEQ